MCATNIVSIWEGRGALDTGSVSTNLSLGKGRVSHAAAEGRDGFTGGHGVHTPLALAGWGAGG